MKNKIVFVMISAFILIGIVISFIIFNRTRYIIHYMDDINIYDIRVQKNYLYVNKKSIVNCLDDECLPVNESSYKTNITKETNEFIEFLFKDTNETEITIIPDYLNEYGAKELSKMIKEDILLTNTLTYEIISSSDINPKYDQKGYYLEKQSDGSYILIISMGEMSSGGYGLKLNSIKVVSDKLAITVEEIYPKGDVVTMVITYPTVAIKLNKLPNDIRIITNNNYPYKEIKDINEKR